MEQYLQETEIQSDLHGDDVWNSSQLDDDESATKSLSGFECNICLDLVRDPVVTFCGHLYCWPCIYRWINFRNVAEETFDERQPGCPVCKADVSHKTLVPLYGRGQNARVDENSRLDLRIPQRPSTPPSCGSGHTFTRNVATNPRPQLSYRQNTVRPSRDTARLEIGGGMVHMSDPMIVGMLRLFGDSETRSVYNGYSNSYHLGVGNSSTITSPRLRRHLIQTEESLGRICFFLFCCVMLCLILF